MIIRSSFALAALTGLILLSVEEPARAQIPSTGLPSPDVISNADHFQPPKLLAYAAKLAEQPDMTGLWAAMSPKGAGHGPTFDPAHTSYPPQPPAGEAGFGPIPGTYIKDIPYNAEFQRKYQDLVRETTEGKSRDDFPACFPYGVPRMIGDSPVPIEIIQTPDVMLWYANYGRTNRRIFLDARQHPTEGDPTTGGLGPSYSGHSIGHWEHNVLVVDTINMVGGYFDETPAPYSDQLHLVERIRLIDTNVLEDQMTFTDPITMTAPWVVTRYFQRVAERTPGMTGATPPAPPPGSRNVVRGYLTLGDRPCVPNVKMDANGFQVAILPQELDALPPQSAKPNSKP
jgi:hypothetical protein